MFSRLFGGSADEADNLTYMLVSRLKWLALFVLVVGFFGFVLINIKTVFAADRTSTATMPTCSDTDGGDKVYVKGTISAYTPTYGNQTVVEYCTDARRTSATSGDYVEELVCLTGDPTYAYTHKWTKCDGGCKDGACLKPKTCSETDRGNNKMLKGKNTIYNGDGTVFTTGEDYCFDKNTVTEITCNGGQWGVTYESCGDGYACDLGACKVVETPKPSCRDTDGGNEIYTKGTLSVYTPTYGNQTVVESCADTRTMDELVCLTGDPTYAYIHQKTTCQYGCKDGVCVATAPTPTPVETPTVVVPEETVVTPSTPTEPAVTQPTATEPVAETQATTPATTVEQTSGEETVEQAQSVIESKPTVAPKVAEKKIGRMFCGNSVGGDGLYSACVKDTIKLDNKINITVRTYSVNYAWFTVKGAKKAYYRIKLGDSIDVVSKSGKETINVTYVKKSPKFGVFLQIDTTL